MLYFSKASDGLGVGDTISRCWKKATIYDCIHVGETRLDNGQNYLSFRYQMPSLPRNYSNISDGFTGYSCEFQKPALLITENINNKRGQLRNNMISLKGDLPNSQPWSHDDAVSFMKANGANENRYFDCAELAALIMNASVAVVGGTDFQASQIMPWHAVD